MILYALAELYDRLMTEGEAGPPGWVFENAEFEIMLNDHGGIIQVAALGGDKNKRRNILVPEHEKRTVKITPFLLRDTGAYLLGVGGKKAKAAEKFAASKELHLKVFGGSDDPAARALVRFFENWDPETAQENPAIAERLEGIEKGGFLTFAYGSQIMAELSEIKAICDEYYMSGESGEPAICLITGQKAPVARLHPNIKGVAGAQSSGAALVSYNADSFESYGKEQGANAPVCVNAANAYTAALNYLLKKPVYIKRMSDTTVVGWTADANAQYSEFLFMSLDPPPPPTPPKNKKKDNPAFLDFLAAQEKYQITMQDITGALEKLKTGEHADFEGVRLDPGVTFYILGLAPNASRLNVRFFLKNTFGVWAENVDKHIKRMEIIRPSYETSPYPSIRGILLRLLPSQKKNNKKKNDKNIVPPPLITQLLKAVLNNTRYPEELLYGTLTRIRADQEVHWERAAILKAYLLKNSYGNKYEEVIKVGLNTETDNQAYLLGRLLALLEQTQEASAGSVKLNSTVKDKYLGAFASTPGLIFAQLLVLHQPHIKKLRRDNPGAAIYLDKEIGNLMDKLSEPISPRLKPDEQAAFMLGYYQQRQKKFEGKAKSDSNQTDEEEQQ